MKILFVSIHIAPGTRAVPLGAASVAASVAAPVTRSGESGLPSLSDSEINSEFNLGINPELVDFFLGDDLSAAVDEVLSRSPDGVGFSIYLWNRAFALSMARKLREERPELLLFAGGPEPTADSTGFSEEPFDFIVAGEGELATRSALEDAFCKDVFTKPRGSLPGEPRVYREPVADPAVLPSPWLTGILNPAGMEGAVWELSRGCPFRCDFCFESRGEGMVRLFPLKRIEQELKLFASTSRGDTAASGVKELFVLDPTFNYNRKRAKELLRLFNEIAPGIRYYLEIRSEYIDQELAELFSCLSCSLQIGLQSAHPDVLAGINRNLDRDDFFEKVLLLHEAGVDYGFDLIYGLPGDSFAGFMESVDFALSMAPNHLDIFPLAVLPGTRLAETASGFGMNYQREYQMDHPYLVLSTPGFSEEEMVRSALIARGIDLFYNQGGGVTWFDILLEHLGVEASDFFVSLSDWLDAEGIAAASNTPSEADLRELQASFVQHFYQNCQGPDLNRKVEDGVSPSGRVMIDVIRLFGGPGVDIPFHYSPAELLHHLNSGVRDPEELSILLHRYEGLATISEEDGEITILN